MPTELLDASVRFPVAYQPWYVYRATLKSGFLAFEYGDMLVPENISGAGVWDRAQQDEGVITTGYGFALEDGSDVNLTTVDIAVAGSAVPLIAESSILPTSLVSIDASTTDQRVTVGTAVLLAAGKVIGRYRNSHEDHQNLRITATDDIVVVLTGVI